MTPARFKQEAEARFRANNQDAVRRGVVLRWTRQPRKVTGPTGHSWWSGAFQVTAPGYRSLTMFADYDGGWMIR